MSAPTKEWLAEQYYSGRMEIPRAHYHVFSEEQHKALADAFARIAVDVSGELRVEKTSLINHIQLQLPAGFPASFASNIYRILAYHSTAPFYPDPEGEVSKSLSLLDVQRALAWLLPDGQLSMSVTGNRGRMRTPADGRRLLFQSLATRSISTAESPDNESVRRRYARRNAYDADYTMKKHALTGEDVDEIMSDWCKTNRDDDGDEMYHDILDVLHRNVPENFPFGSERDDLRPLAKELRTDVKFHRLAIPRIELELFVRELLALQFQSNWSSSDLADLRILDDPTASIMKAFTCDDTELAAAYPQDPEFVSWPAFDHGIQQCAHLFNSIYRLSFSTILEGETELWYLTGCEPRDLPRELQGRKETIAEKQILSYRWMMMMPGILPEVVDWELLHSAVCWRRLQGAQEAQVPPTSDAIWAHIRVKPLTDDLSLPTTVILALEGCNKVSGEQFKGGITVAAEYDGDGSRSLIYSLHFFQLVPSVYYSKIMGAQWRRFLDGMFSFGINELSSGVKLNVDTMTAEIRLPFSSQIQVIELDALEIWEDCER